MVVRPDELINRPHLVRSGALYKTNLHLLEQEIVSGSNISWAICKSAPWPRQITTPASHHSVFYRTNALPATQPPASKHWRGISLQGSDMK